MKPFKASVITLIYHTVLYRTDPDHSVVMSLKPTYSNVRQS